MREATSAAEMARRAKIKAAMNAPSMKRRLHDWLSRSWTPERRDAQAALIRRQLSDREFQARRLAAREATRAKQREAGIICNGMRSHPNHPSPPLPAMSKQERERYTYLRRMTSRENALAVVMADRAALGEGGGG